ncbi:DUF308 domain-containing protein [Streptomyces sp. ODS28]|uniref:HdeD family acid-resistance protein n=1 Tax=Streptomyces sp. ODS28 TaxID=3136688 RepID=UPI0031EAE32E
MSHFSPPGNSGNGHHGPGGHGPGGADGPGGSGADGGPGSPAADGAPGRHGPAGVNKWPDSPLVRLAARRTWQALLAAGAAAVLLGLVVLLWPDATVLVAGVAFGVYLLVSGMVQVIAAFGTRAATATRVVGVLSGAVSFLLGLFCFRGELRSVVLLALWIGVGWVLRGITQIAGAGGDPMAPARGWQIALGVVSVLGGIVLVVSPLSSVLVLAVLGGCWLAALGVVEIATAVRLRHAVKESGGA